MAMLHSRYMQNLKLKKALKVNDRRSDRKGYSKHNIKPDLIDFIMKHSPFFQNLPTHKQ